MLLSHFSCVSFGDKETIFVATVADSSEEAGDVLGEMFCVALCGKVEFEVPVLIT